MDKQNQNQKDIEEGLHTLGCTNKTLVLFLMMMSAIIFFGGIIKFINGQLNNITLLFFGLAAILMLAPKIQSISFGSAKLDLRKEVTKVVTVEIDKVKGVFEQEIDKVKGEAEQAKGEVKQIVKNVGAISKFGIGGKSKRKKNTDRNIRHDDKPVSTIPSTVKETVDNNDPRKGQWGGKPINNDRILKASVQPLNLGDDDWFQVKLTVESTNPADKPLTGKVKFYLHPTFDNAEPEVTVHDGKAELNLIAYGAFTVGAEGDLDTDKPTMLELDLTELQDAPLKFRES